MRKALKDISHRIGAWFGRTSRLNQLVFLVASISLGYGIYLISIPAAFIIMGGLFILLTTWRGPES